MPQLWTIEDLKACIEILQASATLAGAIKKIERAQGREVTLSSLASAFRRRGFLSPTNYLPENQAVSRSPEVPADPMIRRVIALFRKRNYTLHELCDTLDLSPKKVQKLIDSAQAAGFSVAVAHGSIGLRLPDPSNEEQKIKPVDFKEGQPLRIGIVSDMHFGSKYNMGKQVQEFVTQAYKEGVRDFFCPGDVLEGCYRHAQWELEFSDWEGQALSFLRSLPELPGMRFHWIDGNHDWTWTERNGYESGRALVTLAKSRGRHDLFYCGARGAMINYGGTRIELWHPKKGLGYSLSYQLQNHIRDTNPRRLPDLLFAGHWHKYVKLRQQDVWAFASGTFQHADAPYGRSLGGDVSMGGLIVSWRKDSDGVVRKLSDEFRVIDYAAKEYSPSLEDA